VYENHGTLTSMGRHASAIEALPSDIESILGAVRTLFLHVDSFEIYGLPEIEFSEQPRTTLSVSERLDRVFAKSNKPIGTARTIATRELVTCRDYALMTCAMLRQKLVPARVRCGFAKYFTSGRYEDHWICEYWHANDGRWARADAQLDNEHCSHFGIAFDTSDMPEGEFLSANQAWRLFRADVFPSTHFGHGDSVGEWFMWVNLARDFLSLKGHETSPWDSWREAEFLKLILSNSDRSHCDGIAHSLGELEQGKNTLLPTPKPFWLDGNRV
jgi:hypothetical protein